MPSRQGPSNTDDDIFDASSLASLETNPDLGYDFDSDTDDDDSVSSGAMIDANSSYYGLISQYEDDGPIMANRGDSAKKMIRTEEGKWEE
jgi:hypothetical protein